jgi:glycosyltransferase involved in cell wall biosynthesis
MRIAQIAPIVERVPPRKYGGTERVISALTEELVRRGHDVTLFASGDAVTGAKLVSVCPYSLRDAGIHDPRERNGWMLRHIGAAYARATEFDIIHDHCGVFSLPTAELSPVPVVQTMHGAFFHHNIHVFRELSKTNLVTISESQAKGIAGLNAVATIYNGLPMDHYPFSKSPGAYVLYVGRITPLKGTHIAVQVAEKMKIPMVLAAKLEPEHQKYFETEVRPHLSDTIRWVGEVNETQRNQLMKNALCFLHPGLWREPFGLTLIEAMACGCPVVALRRGAIPEIIEHYKTGFIANSIEEIPDYIRKSAQLDREYCRNSVLQRFSASTMVDQYELLYEVLTQKKRKTSQQFARQIGLSAYSS